MTEQFQGRGSGDSRADQNRLISDTTVDVRFETVFPAMPSRPSSLPLAERRLYLLTRVIMDIAAGRAGVPAPVGR